MGAAIIGPIGPIITGTGMACMPCGRHLKEGHLVGQLGAAAASWPRARLHRHAGFLQLRAQAVGRVPGLAGQISTPQAHKINLGCCCKLLLQQGGALCRVPTCIISGLTKTPPSAGITKCIGCCIMSTARAALEGCLRSKQ